MICIYEHNCTDFATNGLGVLRPMACEVTETINGEWELQLTHDIDIDDYGKWSLLQEGDNASFRNVSSSLFMIAAVRLASEPLPLDDQLMPLCFCLFATMMSFAFSAGLLELR